MNKKEKKVVDIITSQPTDPSVETKTPAKRTRSSKTSKTNESSTKSTTRKTTRSPKIAPAPPIVTDDVTLKTFPTEIHKIMPVPVETHTHVYFQFGGTELSVQEVTLQVKLLWSETHTEPLHTLDLYIKPEEHAAYYVINSNITGKLDL